MPSDASWWARKVRQTRAHLLARVRRAEREALVPWTTPAELALFDAMHVADRRHGLDVVRSLEAQGVRDRDVLIAGLLHDCGKGRTGVVPRIVWSLGEAYGPTVHRIGGFVPGLRTSLARLRDHAETSAQLAAEAGCSPLTVNLIRYQEDPHDQEYGPLLKLADEAN
jgi:hypothetical protein